MTRHALQFRFLPLYALSPAILGIAAMGWVCRRIVTFSVRRSS
jgi:hypothetical protein